MSTIVDSITAMELFNRPANGLVCSFLPPVGPDKFITTLPLTVNSIRGWLKKSMDGLGVGLAAHQIDFEPLLLFDDRGLADSATS